MSELQTAVSAERVLKDCLEAFPEVVFAVTGHCMSPDLAEGERVLVVSPARRPPRVGDVVLTRGHLGLRLHRLVWGPPFVPRSFRWRTQADRSSLVDPSLAAEDVLGTVVAVLGRSHASRPARVLRSLFRAVVTRLRSAAGSSPSPR